jgi:hypothetical protein
MNEETLDPKRQLLVSALYGELDPEGEQRFHALLEQDSALRSEWEELREARILLESATEPPSAPEFVFMEPVRADAKPRRRLFGFPLFSPAWGFAGVAAGLVILIGAGLRMDRVDNALVLRFGPAPTTLTSHPVPSSPIATTPQISPPVPVDGLKIEPTAELGAPVTRDDLNAYSAGMLQAMSGLMGEAQVQEKRELAYILGQFYEQLRDEQDRKYESLRQRVDGVGLGLMAEQTRTNARISRLIDQVPEAAEPPDTSASPRHPDKDK